MSFFRSFLACSIFRNLIPPSIYLTWVLIVLPYCKSLPYGSTESSVVSRHLPSSCAYFRPVKTNAARQTRPQRTFLTDQASVVYEARMARWSSDAILKKHATCNLVKLFFGGCICWIDKHNLKYQIHIHVLHYLLQVTRDKRIHVIWCLCRTGLWIYKFRGVDNPQITELGL